MGAFYQLERYREALRPPEESAAPAAGWRGAPLFLAAAYARLAEHDKARAAGSVSDRCDHFFEGVRLGWFAGRMKGLCTTPERWGPGDGKGVQREKAAGDRRLFRIGCGGAQPALLTASSRRVGSTRGRTTDCQGNTVSVHLYRTTMQRRVDPDRQDRPVNIIAITQFSRRSVSYAFSIAYLYQRRLKHPYHRLLV